MHLASPAQFEHTHTQAHTRARTDTYSTCTHMYTNALTHTHTHTHTAFRQVCVGVERVLKGICGTVSHPVIMLFNDLEGCQADTD